MNGATISAASTVSAHHNQSISRSGDSVGVALAGQSLPWRQLPYSSQQFMITPSGYCATSVSHFFDEHAFFCEMTLAVLDLIVSAREALRQVNVENSTHHD